MIDTTGINLVSLIGQHTSLKKAAGTNGGEWAGACPWCGGRDRFRVWAHLTPPKWWCRQCERSGDAIDFLMGYAGKTFLEALNDLNLEPEHKRSSTVVRPAAAPEPQVNISQEKQAACFDPAWQWAADKFVTETFLTLQNNWQSTAGKYLEARGISANAAACYDLGLNITERRAEWGPCEVWLPRGIVIPWQVEGLYWNVRIRRPAADLGESGDKYMPPKGVGNGLYRADLISPASIVVMTEGEFDAMLIDYQSAQAGLYEVVGVATGGVTGARLLRWISRLAIARLVLLAFDADEPGDKAADWWQYVLPKARRLRPICHDITDMHQAGMNLVAWLKESL